jgi:snRNA-activating protein complex (SNAPc), subunit 3
VYLPKVQSIFRDVPRARELLKNLDVSKPLRLKQLKTCIDRDHEVSSGTFFLPAELNICAEEFRTIERPPCFLSSVPPASEFIKGVRDVDGALPCNQTSREVQSGEVVLSFSLYGKSSSSLPKAQRMQDVDVLGSQTLRQLRDSFACGGARGKTTEERSHSGLGHEYAYFLIESTFYATDAVRAANSSVNVSEGYCAPHGVRAVKEWLLNQRIDPGTNIPTREQQPSVNPRDDVTDAGRQVGTRSDVVGVTVTDGAVGSTNGPGGAVGSTNGPGPGGASRASKRGRTSTCSTHQLGGHVTDDGAPSSRSIPSSSATIPNESAGSQGTGSVAALITATEIVSSTERLSRKDGNIRKKKGPKIAKRTFAANWVVDNSDDSDNDVSVNVSSDAGAMPLTTVIGTGSTIASGSSRREPKKTARKAQRAADTVGDSQTTHSRVARTASFPDDRIQSLLEVHGLPPSSTLDILPLDVSLGSLALRAGVRYLYRHGTDASCDCEHFLYLTDMHMHCSSNGSSSSGSNSKSNMTVNSASSVNAFPLFQFQDRPLLRSYPRQTFSAKAIAKKCGVCLLWSARYVVQGDRLADKSPMLYCQ